MQQSDSKNGKQAGRDFAGRNVLGFPWFADRSTHSTSPGGRGAQGAAFALTIQEVKIRECPPAIVFDLLVNANETFWLNVRQRLQQNTAYHREYDGVRPDTERN